jgi:hypothetical protein
MNATIPLSCEDYATAVLLDETIWSSMIMGPSSHSSIQRDGDMFYVILSIPIEELADAVHALNDHKMLW